MTPRKNKLGKESVYDETLKIAVARDYLTGNLSFNQVAKKYNIESGGDTVRWFVRWYQKRYQLQLNQANTSPPDPNRPDAKGIKDLESQLSEANLKIAALEIMIQVAEEDLGIEIRKKHGTKQ